MTGTENPGAPASATGVRNTERTSKSLYYTDSTSAREPEALFSVDLVVGRYRLWGPSTVRSCRAQPDDGVLIHGLHARAAALAREASSVLKSARKGTLPVSQRIGGDVVTQRHLAADLVVSLKPREGLSDD